MRLCTRCKTEKPLADFNGSTARGYQHYCKLCANELARIDYQKNKERYFAHAKARDKRMMLKINTLKMIPCADCKIQYPPICMDFDHLPQYEKVQDISKMMRRRMAWSKIEEEIKKCEVVCSNCHRIRGYVRLMLKGQGHETYLYGWEGITDLLTDVDPEFAQAVALDVHNDEV